MASFLVPAIAGALYGLVAEDGMRLMWEALKAGDPTALGLPAPGAGYSTSWAGIIYTAGRYLYHLGIWAAFLLYLALSKTLPSAATSMSGHSGPREALPSSLCSTSRTSVPASSPASASSSSAPFSACLSRSSEAPGQHSAAMRPGTSRRPCSSAFRTLATRPRSRSSASLPAQLLRPALPLTPSSVSKLRPSAASYSPLPGTHPLCQKAQSRAGQYLG